jgi:hypothetical protein
MILKVFSNFINQRILLERAFFKQNIKKILNNSLSFKNHFYFFNLKNKKTIKLDKREDNKLYLN